MNDIIRELAEQTFYYGNWEGDGIYTGQLDLEKFAKLIVRECIITIQMGISRDGQTTEKYQRSMKHIKQIKQHFGVK